MITERVEFGDRQTFAVSVQLDDDPGGSWLFGHLCYWISNQLVGDFETTASLSGTIGHMYYIAKDAGKRECPELYYASNEDAFWSLNCAIYEDPRTHHNKIPLPELFAVFEGKIPIESFDGWKIYVVDCGNKTRILYNNMENDTIFSYIIDRGLFDSAILDLYKHIDSLIDSIE